MEVEAGSHQRGSAGVGTDSYVASGRKMVVRLKTEDILVIDF